MIITPYIMDGNVYWVERKEYFPAAGFGINTQQSSVVSMFDIHVGLEEKQQRRRSAPVSWKIIWKCLIENNLLTANDDWKIEMKKEINISWNEEGNKYILKW